MSGRSYYIDDNGTEHQIKKIFYTNSEGQPTQIKKDFYEDKNTFSSAHIVTFIIDTGNQQQLEIDDGADVITNAPIATKSGWVFTGWREDSAASSSVVPYMPCNSDNIVMYAVFRRTLTAYFSGNGATSGAVANQTGTQYYNNGNYANPSITMPANGYAKADALVDRYSYRYTFAYWFIPNVGSWGPGAAVPISGNTTFYAYWAATAFAYWWVINVYPREVHVEPFGGWNTGLVGRPISDFVNHVIHINLSMDQGDGRVLFYNGVNDIVIGSPGWPEGDPQYYTYGNWAYDAAIPPGYGGLAFWRNGNARGSAEVNFCYVDL